MDISWQDLTDDERTALKRMNRGPCQDISLEMGQRLVELGLAEMRANGIGISRAGREMVINALLGARAPER